MLLGPAWRHQRRSKVVLRPAWRHQGRSKVPLGLAQSRLGRVITRDQDRMHVRCCIRRCLLLEDARHVFTSLCITWLHSLCNVHGDARVRTNPKHKLKIEFKFGLKIDFRRGLDFAIKKSFLGP